MLNFEVMYNLSQFDDLDGVRLLLVSWLCENPQAHTVKQVIQKFDHVDDDMKRSSMISYIKVLNECGFVDLKYKGKKLKSVQANSTGQLAHTYLQGMRLCEYYSTLQSYWAIHDFKNSENLSFLRWAFRCLSNYLNIAQAMPDVCDANRTKKLIQQACEFFPTIDQLISMLDDNRYHMGEDIAKILVNSKLAGRIYSHRDLVQLKLKYA